MSRSLTNRWATGAWELKAQNSQSRRRRLLHRGLLGQSTVDPAYAPSSAHEFDPQSDDPAELAARAVLAAQADSFGTVPVEEDDEQYSFDGGPRRKRARNDAGLAAIQSLLRGRRPVTWVFTGDNVVQGARYTQGLRNCVEIFTERVRAEMRRGDDVVINTGISGDSAQHLLVTLNRRVLRFEPDVVGLSVGINDCKAGNAGRESFRSDVRELLDRIRTAGGIPLLILPHPVYLPATPHRTDLSHYVEILREESERDEVPYVDQWSDWQQYWSIPAATRSRLLDGRFQLNATAHRHLARLMFRTLDIFDEECETCRGPE